MNARLPATGLQLISTITADGILELRLAESPVQPPGAGEVLVKILATPINPADAGMLLGPADLTTLTERGDRITAVIPKGLMPAVAGRLGQPLTSGAEGAGEVIAAGPDADSQALIGQTVAVFGGGMHAQYRTLRAADVLVLPPGTTAIDGASGFANPLTALGMVETMRLEGHKALVHTAAASNLGQMLVRLCQADGIELVNIVRRPEHVALLRGLGARHVVNSDAPGFSEALTAALAASDATLAFDAIGGGRIAGQILACMEQAQAAKSSGYSRYGTNVHKQVYIYGGLSPAPTELGRSFGMAWGIGGWILTGCLARIGPDRARALRLRVAGELKTIFRSDYAAQVSLRDALKPDIIAAYNRKSTGGKILIKPATDRG